MRSAMILCLCAPSLAQASETSPGDWRGFRGTDGTGIATASAPLEWDDTKNMRWKTALPGAGSSSPVVVGDGVFITCWSGYGLDRQAPGDPADLRRHVLRVDRDSGEIVWEVTLDRAASEDPFEGRMANHGYASGTPVSDGKHLYVQLGKAGVYAFDLDGKQLWHTKVGSGSSKWNTGTGSSPTLWRDRLFINASDESESILALDTATGEKLWSRSSPALDQAYDTPVVAETPEPVVLVALLGAIWGLSPASGDPIWTVKTATNGAMAPSIIVHDDTLYSLGGQVRTRGYAVRLGGSGDVTDSHVLWTSRYGTYVSTPLFFDDHLYWVDEGGIAYCAVAESGEIVYRERVQGTFFASLIKAGDALYAVSRENGTSVLAARPEFTVLAHNVIEADSSKFHGSPVPSDGRLFLRSDRYLYSIGK